MAQRAFWKGYLKLSLVTCPVAMMPVTTESQKVRFHTLNRATGNRVESRYQDVESGKPVREGDEVKGYEVADGQYIVLEDDEIEAVALESTRTIDIESFVPASSIERTWYDRAHYLFPDDSVAAEAFAVIRAAMTATRTVGIARLVLYRREHAVLLAPRDPGIVLWTLHYGDERRDPAAVFDGIAKTKTDPKALKLVERLIQKQSQPWQPDMLKDPVQEELLKLIAAKRKRKSRKPVSSSRETPAEEGNGGNVVSIMEALHRSIEGADKKG
ncbi:DNA end-binding protein Ku [Arboricoccus pini]|uniref:Non-homologous end joining protein Ku n=1 Tax=Arboricoccus pini TaxID=1963835 RepID=A0A212RJC4_9PROT|nr:Ku protein [Arboricoccus pini]SNB72430.1 DNA end-binding protein Ku [Arboricoccus pini]